MDRMLRGILFGLGACAAWGLTFVIPGLMTGASPIEITIGRYFIFGLISSFIFLKEFLRHKPTYSWRIWAKAFQLSIVSTLIYYVSLIFALRYSSPPLTAMIQGISPVVIAFYANWKTKEVSFKHLMLPSLLITIGLVIINIPYLEETPSLTSYSIGLLFNLSALSAWSWFVFANSKFLNDHPDVKSNNWVNLIGLTTMIWVIALSAILLSISDFRIEFTKYLAFTDLLWKFLVGSLVLGVISSWLAIFLWNKASLNLPVSLAGQLTIFQTIFGVTFIYIVNQSFPSLLEGFGIILMFLAIAYAIKSTPTKKILRD